MGTHFGQHGNPWSPPDVLQPVTKSDGSEPARHFSVDAREILTIATEIARFRSATVCSSKDLALAVVVHRKLLADRDFAPVQQSSLSPEMLGFDDSVERLMVGDGELGVAELVDLAASENPCPAEYLA